MPDRSRLPGHGLGRSDPGHARGSAPSDSARSPRLLRPNASTSSASTGRARAGSSCACAGRPAGAPGGRSRPRRRTARTAGRGSAPDARLAARRAPVDGGSAAPRCPCARSGQPRARTLRVEPRGTARLVAPDGRQPRDHHLVAWGADERIRRDSPDSQDADDCRRPSHRRREPSTPAQSAAVVRGIYLYHVRGNGWDDVGYNFLVDRFGQVFEGGTGASSAT